MNHYKKGFIKHVPEFLLPKIKPKIIDNIVREDKIIGKIVGINLKPIDYNHESEIQEYLKAIKKLKVEDCTELFIEGYENLNKETIDYIKEFMNLTIPNGEGVRIMNLSSIMRNLYNLIGDNLEEKEVLVICDNNETTKKIIKEISKDLRFVTIIGCDQSNTEEIYEYILEETGLSLFYPSNIDRILENYSIIINLIDNINLDFSKVRRNCIIFDFSQSNFLANKKRLPVIEDFAFNLNSLGINETKWINSMVRSNLFQSLAHNKSQNIKYLYSENNYYTIKDYVNTFIKLKGKL